MKEYFVKKSRKDIYLVGRSYQVTLHTKKYPEGKVVTRYNRSQPFVTPQGIEQDRLLIKKGESYYWIKFKYQPKRVKTTPFTSEEKLRYPKSEWIERIDDLTLEVANIYEQEDKDSVQEKLEELKEELESSLENIPEQLKESHILTQYIEQVEDLLTEVEEKEIEDE